MKQNIFGIICAFVIVTASSSAFSAGEGTAVGVNPDALARINSQDRILSAGTDVSVGERIVTGPSGQVQIVFDDETRLVVGPDSSLLIETYLLASSNIAQKLTINALGGSFRFITGNSPKPAYTINTPTAAIAVRGTKFDLLVGSLGTGVLLYEGALQLCGAGNGCVDLSDRCAIGTAAGGGTELVQRSNSAPLSAQFRFARFQTSLLDGFRINGAGTCVEPAPDGTSPESLSPGSDDDDFTPQPEAGIFD